MSTDDHKNKKTNFWQAFFSKEDAIKEAQEYSELTFFKKSKNCLVIFISFICLLTFSLALSTGIGSFSFEDLILGAIIYMLFLPFIFFNHRWAIVIVCLLYTTDKIIYIIDGVGSPLSQLIFGALMLSLSYKSFIVATYLKKEKIKSNNENDTGLENI